HLRSDGKRRKWADDCTAADSARRATVAMILSVFAAALFVFFWSSGHGVNCAARARIIPPNLFYAANGLCARNGFGSFGDDIARLAFRPAGGGGCLAAKCARFLMHGALRKIPQ